LIEYDISISLGGSSHTSFACVALSRKVDILFESIDVLAIKKVLVICIVVKSNSGDCVFYWRSGEQL
jgi:hypothetical protein